MLLPPPSPQGQFSSAAAKPRERPTLEQGVSIYGLKKENCPTAAIGSASRGCNKQLPFQHPRLFSLCFGVGRKIYFVCCLGFVCFFFFFSFLSPLLPLPIFFFLLLNLKALKEHKTLNPVLSCPEPTVPPAAAPALQVDPLGMLWRRTTRALWHTASLTHTITPQQTCSLTPTRAEVGSVSDLLHYVAITPL